MARRAVLIGINDYAMQNADLRGCVNDVRNLQTLLGEVYGFTDDEIVTLEDGAATQAAMQAAIADLVTSACPGDTLLLHYSGHGSHVADTSGDESDGRDEILCPHDMNWDAPFLDDWLRTALDQLPDGADLTVVMDCCHSGSNTREIPRPDAPLQRYLPNPLLDEAEPVLRAAVPASAPASGRSRRGRRRRGSADVHEVDITETLITGCRDDQTSADAPIDGTFHGALTYHLVSAVRELGPDASFRQVHARTLELLKGRFTQVPQLEGRAANLDRPFLARAAD